MKVFRDKLKARRGNYFVTYQPADCRSKFAVVNLTFLVQLPETGDVAVAMERELEDWLRRFPVPAMVFAFDAKDDLISLRGRRSESHLMGIPSTNGANITRWGTFRDDELPLEITSEPHFDRVYAGVPHRSAEAIRRSATTEAKAIRRVVAVVAFFMIIVPFAIQLASLGIAWIGYLTSLASIVFGAHKAAKALGWIKPSPGEKQKAEKESKMEHYYYHCERNPEGFSRLKIANFEREAIEQNLLEANAIPNEKGD